MTAPTGSTQSTPRLPFGRIFFGLRQAGVRVSPTEWMTLMEALASGAIEPDLNSFHAIGRSILIKHEAHFDTWDQVFTAVFGEGEMPVNITDELLDWLETPLERPRLTGEELAALEQLDLEELRKRFLERLEEQKERHDGGNRWIGTGGTSPFGHSGVHPGGIRVGGEGGGKTAAQVAAMRRFRDYRNDRVLDTRNLAVALRKLRRLNRVEGEPELDIEMTIDKTGKNAGELELAFQPPRKNQARVLLMMDVGGSMTPFSRLVETLFSAASSLNHWKKFENYFFHNCVYSRLFKSMTSGEVDSTAELLLDRPRDTFLIIIGDASMAPSELLSANGAIDWFERSETSGLVWLHRLRAHFSRCVWLNPMPREHWRGYTLEVIESLFPMFPLSIEGLEEAVEYLVKKGSPDPIPELDPRMLRV